MPTGRASLPKLARPLALTTLALALAAVFATPASATPGCGSTGVYSISNGNARCAYSTVGTDTFTVPPYQPSVIFDLSGAGQGTTGCVGPGGKVRGELAVDPFDDFQVRVGGLPGTGVAPFGCAGAGFNGGGSGGSGDPAADLLHGSGGGGASDVRVGAHSLTDRIFVAGGGGGHHPSGLPSEFGGSGGGENGTAGAAGRAGNSPGGGGSQFAAGASPGSATSAGFGFGGGGGNGATGFFGTIIIAYPGHGGGGGYYGGGGSNSGSDFAGGGGGGSGYITPLATDKDWSTGTYKDGSGRVTVSWPDDPVTATVTLTADKPNPIAATELVRLTAHVTTSTGVAPVGMVFFVANGRTNLGSGFVDGEGNLTVAKLGSSLPRPSNDVVAIFQDYHGVIERTSSSELDVDRLRLDQTVSFTSTPPSIPTAGGTYTVSATASSGLPVTFSVPAVSASVCSISGSTVSFLAAGTCVIKADQAGNGTYAAAPTAQQAIDVDWGSSPIPITATVSGVQTEGGTPHFIYTSNSPPGVTLSGTLSCTAVGLGTPIDPSLALGSYTIAGSSCSGLTPSDTEHYTVTYVGKPNGFVVTLPVIEVTVSGSQTFGGTPTFTYTSDAPDGVTLTGNVSCTGLVGAVLHPGLGPGSYTLAGCSGLSASGGYAITFVGGTFEVEPALITVTVSGAQGYGGGPAFTFTDDSPLPVFTSVTCTGLTEDDLPIAPSLDVGAYTIDPSTCSGYTPPFGYTVQYESEIGGYLVNPVEVVVTVSGEQVYGGSPGFDYIDNSLGRVTVSGTLSCDRAMLNRPIDATLPVGDYSVVPSSCHGLSLSDPANFRLTYVATANAGYRVWPATITVNASGSMIQGGTPEFTYDDDAPDGVTLSGELTCTVVKGTGVGLPSLTPGTYTLDGRFDWCSGLTASDATNFNLVYEGVTNGFEVTPGTINVDVSGTQTYGGSAHFTGDDDAPAGVTLSGSLSCDTVDSGTDIDSTLTAGTYTVDGSSCEGLSAAGYDVSYSGVTDGYVVSPATIHVHAWGAQSYGGGPHFTKTDDAPAGVTLSGTLTCDTVDSGTDIAPALTAGDHTIDGSSCDGLTPSDTTNYTIVYDGVTDGFVVSPATANVRVSGTQTFGGSATFTQTNDAPAAAGLGGTPSCTKVGTNTTIDASLPGGSYTVLGSSCSGMTLGDSTNYEISYAGVTNGFVVGRASTSIVYGGQQLVMIGNSLVPSATLSSPVAACKGGKTVSFSLDANPLTGAAASYPLGSATTNSSGQATGAGIATAGWLEGQYTITASFAATASCDASSYEASLAVASPGAAASGGGWYSLSGTGRSNFGFNVRKVSNTTNSYKGQLLLINNGKWRIKGTLTGYGLTGTSGLTATKAGSATGTGSLYWWNPALNAGLGGWQLAQSPLSFTINFSASAAGKKASPGSFGIQFGYRPVSPQPSALPTSVAQLLKGGTVNVS